MSEASKSLGGHERVGPDYFGYYSSEVVNLLSQDEDVLSVATDASEVPQNKCGEGENNAVGTNGNCSGELFSDGIGAGLSDLKKDRLRSLLRQSVTTLSSEVDEVVDPVFAIHQLQSKQRSKKQTLDHTAVASNNAQHIPCKKSKILSPPSSASLHEQFSDVNPTCSAEVNDDLQFLLENDSVEVQEMVKNCANELNGTLEYMEKQLEVLLDAVTSKCRPMTLGERQQLQRMIQKLPAKNLDRIAEIICRSRPTEQPNCDKIFVDLEKEDNATLWRLYYYVEAVEKAKTLSCTQEV
ncbi:uncharacterized protein LOC130981745 [Arachis stenosperma]|uniref:uncharacterized protein LOC130981745 n=1 Tax=Arachis stenosperma TaxID=217475 RepID=UPI0025AC342F|nr:uncharacterized protein LOC130981745 [Arachis stenosperma]XP_057761405.1 uncharacterized protein LOC130981745 [Arachis stenosperma]